jgi:hypothetical protein
MTRGAIDRGGLQPLNGGKIGNTPAMKITDIKTFLVGAGGRNWVYVKVLTDQGIYGIGEAYSAGPDEATVKVIEDFKSWLIGNDPRNVQYLFDLMYNTTRFPGGIITIWGSGFGATTDSDTTYTGAPHAASAQINSKDLIAGA